MAIREIASTVPGTLSLRGFAKDSQQLAVHLESALAPVLRAVSLAADWIEQRQVAIAFAQSPFTITDETVILANATSGVVAVLLPASSTETINRDLYIKKTDTTVNSVTITAHGSDLIDTTSTVSITTEGQCYHLLSDGLGNWRVLSTIAASGGGGLAIPATAAPIIVNLTPAAVGTSVKYAREDHRHLFDVTIDPTGANAWTGIHAWSPDSNAVPITINTTASLTSANMQTWSPLGSLDTVVDRLGNVGAGDETPTANVSIRQRAVDISQSAILALNPYAWWYPGDVDGNNTNNAAYSDGASIATWTDKSGNGHNLAKDSVVTNTLHKTGGPNNKAWMNSEGWLAWSGSAFGNNHSWAWFSVGRFNQYTVKAVTPDQSGILALGGVFTNCHLFTGYPEASGTHEYTFAKNATSTPGDPPPTSWSSTGIGDVYSHCHTYVGTTAGTHTAYCMGVELTNNRAGYPRLFGADDLRGTTNWGRLHRTGGSPDAFATHADVEIIVFDREITNDERLLVEAYLSSQYDSAYVASASAQPLTDWKTFTGSVDSIVDLSLNFGLGTAATTPAAKLHVVKTTEQLRLGYDATTNYFQTTVGSAGGVTFDTHGATPQFTFADPVNITGLLAVTGAITATTTIAATGTISGSNLSVNGVPVDRVDNAGSIPGSCVFGTSPDLLDDNTGDLWTCTAGNVYGLSGFGNRMTLATGYGQTGHFPYLSTFGPGFTYIDGILYTDEIDKIHGWAHELESTRGSQLVLMYSASSNGLLEVNNSSTAWNTYTAKNFSVAPGLINAHTFDASFNSQPDSGSSYFRVRDSSLRQRLWLGKASSSAADVQFRVGFDATNYLQISLGTAAAQNAVYSVVGGGRHQFTGAITGSTTIAATGAVTGSNLSGVNTGDDPLSAGGSTLPLVFCMMGA